MALVMKEIVERWRGVSGFLHYLVSDLGNVRRTVAHGNHAPGELRQSRDSDGYRMVSLWNGERQHLRRTALVVLAAFIGPCPPMHESNHKNGRIDDNRLENLEYVTKAQNIKHSIEVLGRDYRGEGNPDARLTDAKVIRLRERAARGESFTALGIAFGISGMAAGAIATGKAWSHVGGPIVPPPGPGRRRRA